jgi:hypothetical protein
MVSWRMERSYSRAESAVRGEKSVCFRLAGDEGREALRDYQMDQINGIFGGRFLDRTNKIGGEGWGRFGQEGVEGLKV